MEKWSKVRKTTTIINFIIHILAFVFTVIATLLPYKEYNFYKGAPENVLLLLLPIASTVLGFMTTRWTVASLAPIFLDTAFFVIIILPYCMEEMVISLINHGGGEMPQYGIGFEFLMIASNIVYIDMAFVVLVVVTLLLEDFTSRKRFRKIK